MDKKVAVRAGDYHPTADFVIGADGANGITARAVNLRRTRAIAIAQEVEHPHNWGAGRPELRRDTIHLEYGAVRHGYAWIFPKADHLNVGAGLFRPRSLGENGGVRVRDEIQGAICGYLDLMNVPYDRSRMQFHAHPLPIWNGREPLASADGRILLAGDAAGLVNPVFGDGILHAVKSGLIAAESVASGNSQAYTLAVHRELAANFDSANKLAAFFYQWTGTVYKYAIKHPTATHTAARLLCGDALFTDVAGRAVKRLKRNITPGRTAGEIG
jgi:flavin-dependent dehydrogenase